MKYLLFLLFVFFIGCNCASNKIDKLIYSDRLSDNMKAYYLIGEKKDSSFVPILIQDLDDSRISHNYRFLGMSGYQSKIGALRKISGLNPPNEVSYRPDSVNIKYYRQWAKEQGYKIDNK